MGSKLAVLRALLPLADSILSGYRPVELPKAVQQFIARADRRALQTAFVEIAARLYRGRRARRDTKRKAKGG